MSTIKPDTWSSLLNSVTSLATSLDAHSESVIPVSLQPLDHLTLSQLLTDSGITTPAFSNVEALANALSSVQSTGNTLSTSLDTSNLPKISLDDLMQLLPHLGLIASDQKQIKSTVGEEKNNPQVPLNTGELENLSANLPNIRPRRLYGGFHNENHTFSQLADVIPFDVLKVFPFMEIGEDEEFDSKDTKSLEMPKHNSMSTDENGENGEKVDKSISGPNTQAKYGQDKEEDEEEDEER